MGRRTFPPWLTYFSSPGVRSRVRFLKWEPNYLKILAMADIVIDTFPSGGGFVLMDAMALGIPVVSFGNDYMKRFDQTDWSVGVEIISIPELIIERGDVDAFQLLVSRLIADPAYRRRTGEECRERIFQDRGHPERMVKRYENVYRKILEENTGKDKGNSNHGEMLSRSHRFFSGLRSNLVPRMIRNFPSSYSLLHKSWRYLARARKYSRALCG